MIIKKPVPKSLGCLAQAHCCGYFSLRVCDKALPATDLDFSLVRLSFKMSLALQATSLDVCLGLMLLLFLAVIQVSLLSGLFCKTARGEM